MPATAPLPRRRARDTGLRDVIDQGAAVFQTGNASSSWWKTAATFFQHKQGGRFGERLVLAMQLALQFLDPSAVFPSLGGTGRPRFAQTGNGILFPAIESAGYRPCSRHRHCGWLRPSQRW